MDLKCFDLSKFSQGSWKVIYLFLMKKRMYLVDQCPKFFGRIHTNCLRAFCILTSTTCKYLSMAFFSKMQIIVHIWCFICTIWWNFVFLRSSHNILKNFDWKPSFLHLFAKLLKGQLRLLLLWKKIKRRKHTL